MLLLYLHNPVTPQLGTAAAAVAARRQKNRTLGQKEMMEVETELYIVAKKALALFVVSAGWLAGWLGPMTVNWGLFYSSAATTPGYCDPRQLHSEHLLFKLTIRRHQAVKNYNETNSCS